MNNKKIIYIILLSLLLLVVILLISKKYIIEGLTNPFNIDDMNNIINNDQFKQSINNLATIKNNITNKCMTVTIPKRCTTLTIPGINGFNTINQNICTTAINEPKCFDFTLNSVSGTTPQVCIDVTDPNSCHTTQSCSGSGWNTRCSTSVSCGTMKQCTPGTSISSGDRTTNVCANVNIPSACLGVNIPGYSGFTEYSQEICLPEQTITKCISDAS